MKKMVCISMALIMMFSTVSIAFAEERQPPKFNPVVMGATEILNVETINANEKTYVAMYDDIKNIVTEKNVENGVLYTFEQGDLLDELLVTNDGSLYLDGNKIEIREISNNASNPQTYSNISPRAFYDYWEYGNSPFASGSYTYARQQNMVLAEFGRAITAITAGTFATAIIVAIYPGAAAAVGKIEAISSAVFYEIIRQTDPTATSAYLKRTKWHNNNPDLSSSPLKYYYKVNIIGCYDAKGQEETSYNVTNYAIYNVVNH